MQINKIKLGAITVIATVTGVCGYKYHQDYANSEKIKTELKAELEEFDSFPSTYDYNIAEFREPLFFRTAYWENVADNLRNEIKIEKTQTKQKN